MINKTITPILITFNHALNYMSDSKNAGEYLYDHYHIHSVHNKSKHTPYQYHYIMLGNDS